MNSFFQILALKIGEKAFTLRPERWPQWYVAMGSDQNDELQRRKENFGEQRQFIFKRIHFYEPYCYIKSKK